MQNQVELLAPAGNQETFLSAISAGANAIYVGLKDFSARAKAKNFSISQLYQLCNYAKEKNVKVFVAFNTLLQQQDINKAIKVLEQLNSISIDGLIVQDLSIVQIVKKYFPNINLHASTQLCIHNSYGAKQAQEFGFKRAVLARELSLEQIKQIKKQTNIELEIFYHGALCFCVSGLCLFSSFIGGYSGNRGHCTQPCRRLWTINNKQGYFLSPKDLQLSNYIQELKSIGVTSLKIEGRMKSAEYVYKTVKAYKLLLDSTSENFNENLLQAQDILQFDYARTKTTCNFINKSTNIFESNKSKNLGLYLGKIESKTDTYFSLNSNYKINVGDTLRIVDLKKDKSSVLIVNKLDVNKIFYENMYIEKDFEVYKIADNNKYEFKNIFNENIKLPQQQNISLYIPKFKQETNLPQLFVRINNLKWITLLKNKFSVIIKINKTNLLNVKAINDIKNYYIELPSYIDEQDLKLYKTTIDFFINKGCMKFFVNNISQLQFFNNKNVELFSGQYLYTLNSYSADLLSSYKIKAFTTSWEDDISNIKSLSKLIKNKLIVYLSGFPELVISKMEFIDEIKNKNIKSNKDEFKIVSTNNENIIIPKYPINLFPLKNNLVDIKSFAIDLSYIEPNKTYLEQIINAFNGKMYISSTQKFNFERKLI